MTILHSLTTVAGHNKEAAKKALNQPVVFTHIALGDDDRYPTGGETELGNEVHRGAITGKGTVPGVPNATFFDITVPDAVATFFAREIGLIDEDGVLYALSRYDAPIPKFGPDSANQSAFTFRIIVIFSATANIIIEVDPGWKHTIDAQLRPDFRSVEAIHNDPPVAPVAGQTWIVGLAPTGTWGGHENELAEWSGSGWSFASPTPWMHVGLADRTDWRWDHTLGEPAWVPWLATLAEAKDPLQENKIIDPKLLHAVIKDGGSFKQASTRVSSIHDPVPTTPPIAVYGIAPITAFADDGQGDWVQVGDKIVCQTPGRYQVLAYLGAASRSGACLALTPAILRAGAEYLYSSIRNTTETVLVVGGGAGNITDFVAGDELEFGIYRDGSTATTVAVTSSLTLLRLATA